MKRAGLEEACYVIGISNSLLGRSYFIGIENDRARFTTDIQWARAYKSAKRAAGRIPEISRIMGIDENCLYVIQYRKTRLGEWEGGGATHVDRHRRARR